MIHPEPPPAHLALLRRSLTGAVGSWDLLRSLCDEVGPRFPCSPGDVAAVAWAEQAMAAAGLTNVRSEAAPATLWERGAESCTLFMPRAQPVTLSALGGSVGTGPSGLEAEIVEFPSLEALDAAPRERIQGKVVFLRG